MSRSMRRSCECLYPPTARPKITCENPKLPSKPDSILIGIYIVMKYRTLKSHSQLK